MFKKTADLVDVGTPYDTALHCTLCIAQYGATYVCRTPFNFVPTRPGSQRGDLIYITVVGQL